MRRSEIFALMTELGMRGMKAVYDEVVAAEGKHKRGPEWVLGSLLQAEVVDKQARSIKYQMTIARLPHAKDLAEFRLLGQPCRGGHGATARRRHLHRGTAQLHS